MLHKRKRSTTTLSPPSSLPLPSTTVQAFYPHSKPILSPFHTSDNKLPSFDPDTPSHLNIRTRKRHRDNRPDADSIHGASTSASPTCWLGAVIHMRALADVSRIAASTIQRLYEAQRVNIAAEPGVAPESQQQQQHNEPPQPHHQPTQPQKSTLHTFWHISQPLPTTSQTHTPLPSTIQAPSPRCEDCDNSLVDASAMEIDERGSAPEDKACGSCRRPVCDACAVYGRERVCAGCAGCERGW